MLNVYVITNRINHKVYVGFTGHEHVGDRLKEHIRASRRPFSKLHFAIRKYGENAFSIESICCCKDTEAAYELERHFITEYDSIKLGYNMTGGGTGGATMVAWSQRRIDQFRNTMSLVTKGHKRWSKESRKRLSQSIKQSLSRRTGADRSLQYKKIAAANISFSNDLSANPSKEIEFRCSFLRETKEGWRHFTNDQIINVFREAKSLLDANTPVRTVARIVSIDRNILKKLLEGTHWSLRHM